MKRRLLSILATASVCAAPTLAQTLLYGTTTDGAKSESNLYQIDPATGAGTLVGGIGFNRCSSLEADAAGTLFAVCDRTSDGASVLVTIDRSTGAGTEIGELGDQGNVTDISFAPSGTLFAYLRSKGDLLLTIDTVTGGASLVGDTGLQDSGNGISFSGATLFHAGGGDVHTLDTSDGSATSVCAIDFPDLGGGGERINAMDAHPATQVLFASVLNPEPDLGAPDAYLATVDTTTCAVTLIGSTSELDGTLDGLAFLVVPDLAITKSDSPDPVTAGGLLTYTLTVENLGLAEVTDVVVTDTLPAAVTLVSSSGCTEDPAGGDPTCTIASILAGESAVVTLVVEVDEAFSGILTNLASIAPSPANQVDSNDSATAETTVSAPAPSDIPALSEWALGALVLLLTVTGVLFARRA